MVFNPLSWQRSGMVEIDLDKGLELVDLATNRVVPCEVLSTGPACRRVRFLAQDVPSVGYKAYALKETKAEPPTPQTTAEGTIENQYYQVVLDPASGAVKSIFDKELNKELVNASRVILFNGQKKIEFINHVHKTETARFCVLWKWPERKAPWTYKLHS